MSRLERSPPDTNSTSPVFNKESYDLKNNTCVTNKRKHHETEGYQTKSCPNTKSLTQFSKGKFYGKIIKTSSQSPPLLKSTSDGCMNKESVSEAKTNIELKEMDRLPVSSQVESTFSRTAVSPRYMGGGSISLVKSVSPTSSRDDEDMSPRSSRSGSPSSDDGRYASSSDLSHSSRSISSRSSRDRSLRYSRSASSNSSSDRSPSPTLREFDVLDELEDVNQEEGEIIDSSSYDSDSESGEEIPVDDVDAMLEEGLPEKFKNSRSNTIQLRRKVVLEEIGHNHFDLLPEGWIQIMHCSGMPVFLHKKSRVCTMARPYYLGPGSSRNHKIPLSAIPCLQYKRALELEEKKKNEEKPQSKREPQSEIEMMTAEIETFEENEANQSLESPELNDYCKKLFRFKTLNMIPFRSWTDRRKFAKMTRDIQKKERPALPGGTKLIKCPLRNPDGSVPRSKREWIMNPNGKSYVCILHEYVQHALKKHPKYQFKELENSATPYSATVFIDNIKYGFGAGASKKQAKVEAAKIALEVLIPGMKDKIERDSQSGMGSGITKRSDDSDISIFDEIKIEDPRVAEFCAKSTEPPPYAILLTCLSRNTGVGDIKVSYEMSSSSKGFKQDEYTMVVGNHKVTIPCKNKREGKQRAAQAILQALHPNITYWGSLLRMYGNRSIKHLKEKKQEEQEITVLQSKASINQPNFAILDKLVTEMQKLKDKREAVKAKGTFTLPKSIVLPSLSSADLNKVKL